MLEAALRCRIACIYILELQKILYLGGVHTGHGCCGPNIERRCPSKDHLVTGVARSSGFTLLLNRPLAARP